MNLCKEPGSSGGMNTKVRIGTLTQPVGQKEQCLEWGCREQKKKRNGPTSMSSLNLFSSLTTVCFKEPPFQMLLLQRKLTATVVTCFCISDIRNPCSRTEAGRTFSYKNHSLCGSHSCST